MAACVILAPSRAVLSSVALASDLLGVAAIEAAADVAGERDGVLLASAGGVRIRCGNATLVADTDLADITSCDLVWVAGFWGDPVRGLAENASIVPWLAQQHAQGAVIAAHGPASFLVAEAGLLDGRLATTYVAHAAEFARRYPSVDLQTGRLITDAGGVHCCVGMNSGADLLIMLIERTYGRRIASSVSRWALSDSQRSYQVGMTAFDGQKYHGDGEIAKVQGWLEQNYDGPVTLSVVAASVGMSARTLTRRFTAATGETPSTYLSRLRVEAAKDLLRQTQSSVSEIAARVGYRDVGAFYDMFGRHTGLRPGQYRSGPVPGT